MSDKKKIFTFPKPETDREETLSLTPSERQARKPAIVLDMGEASREEGFRLNGCR